MSDDPECIPRYYRQELDLQPSDVRRVRHEVRSHLRLLSLDDAIDDTLIVVSELLTNVLKHTASKRCVLEVGPEGAASIKITCTDDCINGTKVRPYSADSESGRGMQAVSTLAAITRTVPLEGYGKRVEVYVPARIPAGCGHS